MQTGGKIEIAERKMRKNRVSYLVDRIILKFSSLSFLLSENNQKIDKKMKKKIQKSPKQSKTSTSLSLHASRPHAQIQNPLFAQEMPRPYLNHALEIIKKEKEKKIFFDVTRNNNNNQTIPPKKVDNKSQNLKSFIWNGGNFPKKSPISASIVQEFIDFEFSGVFFSEVIARARGHKNDE